MWEFPGVQWLEFHTFTAEGSSVIPGRGTKIPQAVQCSKKKIKNVIKLKHISVEFTLSEIITYSLRVWQEGSKN